MAVLNCSKTRNNSGNRPKAINIALNNYHMRYLIFFTALLCTTGLQAQKLVKQKLDDNIIVKIPAGFYPMTAEDRQQRYQSPRIPLALFTSPDRMVDFGVNRSFSIWQEGDLKLMQDFYEASINELYDKVNFLDKGIKTVNKRDFVFFEFESIVYPETKFQDKVTKYTYLMYVLKDGTTYLFNFTCPLPEKGRWQETARAVMSSIKLK